ncbi:MAG TPA: ATP-binding protein [Anaerolineae bacterium]
MKIFSGLRPRLVFSHLTVIILAMGLSGLLLFSLLERYFLQATEDSLIAQARITVQALIPGALTAGPTVDAQAPLNNAVQQQQYGNLSLQTENLFPPDTATTDNSDLSYLSRASIQLGTQLNTRIRILDKNGKVMADSQATDLGVDLRTDPLAAQALTGQYASRVDSTGEVTSLAVALPARLNDQLIGVAYLSQSLGDVLAVLQDLRARWMLATAIALVSSGAVGLLLSRAITRPLRSLTTAAEAVAQGRFDQPVPARSHDEIGRLSHTFNDMMARLQAARQMQVDFVANVSHELRTPLTSLKGTVETLRGGAIDDLEVRDRFLETIEGETDRLIRLVSDLLLLSRADSQALDLRRERLDLAGLVQETIERLAPQAAARGLTLRAEIDPNAPAAWADADRVAQVMVNLLDNALKYSRPGGSVTVSVSATPERFALIQVRDEGIGIPAADLPRVGQRFYRADKARSRAQGGNGLGFAIAHSLVQAHGGRLWLDSHEGVGTTASFTLPPPP